MPCIHSTGLNSCLLCKFDKIERDVAQVKTQLTNERSQWVGEVKTLQTIRKYFRGHVTTATEPKIEDIKDILDHSNCY